MATKRERDAQRARAESEARELFVERISTLQSIEEALTMVYNGPGPDAPGRRCYSAFGFFLGAGGMPSQVPMGGKPWELRHFKTFIERLDDSAVQAWGKRSKADVLRDLDHAIETRDDYD